MASRQPPGAYGIMSEKVVFWYGCNVVRHGDIIHGSIEILRAIGLEVAPVGGPSYCCGTSKDANLRAADGMAKRTVGKFNDSRSGLPKMHRQSRGSCRRPIWQPPRRRSSPGARRAIAT